MMRFGTVFAWTTNDPSEPEKHLPIGIDLSAKTLEEAIAETERLAFPEGSNLIKIIDRDKGGTVVHKVLKAPNANRT